MWIQTGVRVRKRLSWVLTSVTLTFDLWPWPFAWTSLLTMVITPENFMMIQWWEHGEKGVTDRQTDGRTDGRTDGLNQSYSCLVAAKKNFQSSSHKPFVKCSPGLKDYWTRLIIGKCELNFQSPIWYKTDICCTRCSVVLINSDG